MARAEIYKIILTFVVFMNFEVEKQTHLLTCKNLFCKKNSFKICLKSSEKVMKKLLHKTFLKITLIF